MTHLVERLAELRRHVDHLKQIRSKVTGPDLLERDLSLHNDVLFSLLSVCQLVIDIASELAAARSAAFDDYTQAVRNLSSDPHFPPDLVESLARLPGFRNVIVHEYVELDADRVIGALSDLDPLDRFIEIVSQIERESDRP